MKIDQTTMIIGGVLVVGVIVLIMSQQGQTHGGLATGMRDLADRIEGLFGGGGLTSGDEEEQAAMYADYY